MLSNTIIKHYGIRVSSMVYTGLTTYGWDQNRQELTPPPHKWLYWNWNISNSMGYCLCGCFVVHIYIKWTSRNDESGLNLTSFAAMVFTVGELTLIMAINILASRIRTMQNEIRFTTNQLFKYHKEVSNWLEERKIVLDETHNKRILAGEIILIIVCYATFVFPIIAFAVVFHPVDPIHNLVKDWLEFELTLSNLSWSLLTLVPPLFVSVLAIGNTILVIGGLSVFSYLVTIGAIEDMTPIRIIRMNGYGRYTFQTRFFGQLTDEDIVQRYRVQQLFNLLANQVFGSWAISLHHVATLAVICIGAFFLVKFPNVIQEAGMIGYAIVFGMISLALWVEYLETMLVGNLSEMSDMFNEQGRKLVGRRALFSKFARSCQTLTVYAAYPFYNVNKTTFLEFVDTVLDKTITLLLW